MTMTLNESTVRIEVLGEELRRLREACGLTLAQVCARIGFSLSHLSRMENGRRPQGIEDVAGLLAVYGIVGEERLELLALARRASQPGLWQRQGSFEARFATLTVLESRATALVNFEPLMIPGLLQTVPYAEAIFREVGLIEGEEAIGERVATRIHRQGVLRRFDPPTMVAIVAETALRNMVGGAVMRDQLRYLAEVAERPNITLRVLATAAGGHPGLNGTFLRMRFAERPSVVFLENRTSSLFLEDHQELAVYDKVIVELLGMAMSEPNSVRLVAEMAANLE